MTEINFSNYDRNLLEEIKYHLETIATGLEKKKSMFYDIGDNACIINLSMCIYILKSSQGSDLHFYLEEGYPPLVKVFKTEEARDIEFNRIMELMTK